MNRIDKALERVKTWPPERQQDVVQLLEVLEAAGTATYRLSEEERAAVQIGLIQADRGEFISEEEMEAFWRRHSR